MNMKSLNSNSQKTQKIKPKLPELVNDYIFGTVLCERLYRKIGRPLKMLLGLCLANCTSSDSSLKVAQIKGLSTFIGVCCP